MRGFKSRLFGIVAVSLMTVIGGATASSAAGTGLAKPTDAQMKTTDPATTCVRGAARPFIGVLDPRLEVFVPSLDMNEEWVSVEFRISTLRDGRVVWTGASSSLPRGIWISPPLKPELLNATSYSWQARVVDGTSYSPWSNRCEFTTDTDRPNAPGLTITPEGPYHIGQEITLHFSNAGSADVVKYGYGVMDDVPTNTVPACPGTAKVILDDFGPTPIMAWSYDRAGTQSSATRVVIDVNFNP